MSWIVIQQGVWCHSNRSCTLSCNRSQNLDRNFLSLIVRFWVFRWKFAWCLTILTTYIKRYNWLDCWLSFWPRSQLRVQSLLECHPLVQLLISHIPGLVCCVFFSWDSQQIHIDLLCHSKSLTGSSIPSSSPSQRSASSFLLNPWSGSKSSASGWQNINGFG